LQWSPSIERAAIFFGPKQGRMRTGLVKEMQTTICNTVFANEDAECMADRGFILQRQAGIFLKPEKQQLMTFRSILVSSLQMMRRRCCDNSLFSL